MASYEKNKNGLWSVRFRAFENGVEKNKRLSGYKTRKDAEKGYANYLNGTIQRPINKNEEITFQKLVSEYLRFCSNRIKKSTMYDRENRIKNHILPRFGEMNVTDIRPIDIAEWQSELSNKYSYRHASEIRTVLGSIFSFGDKYYDLPNPIVKVDTIRNTEPKKEMRVWTIEQFDTFITVVDDVVERTYFTLLFCCGLRRGEARALTWKDYDFKTQRLSINKSVTEKEKGKAWSITTPKNKQSVRNILVPERVHNALVELKRQSKGTYIFHGDRPMPAETTRRHFSEYAKKAKVPVIRIHDLRHSCASHLLSTLNGRNISPVAVAKYLGHTVEMLLETYAHLLPNEEKEIVKKFDF